MQPCAHGLIDREAAPSCLLRAGNAREIWRWAVSASSSCSANAMLSIVSGETRLISPRSILAY
jgi:hypothetical protein